MVSLSVCQIYSTTLKSLDSSFAMTFILNNNNNMYEMSYSR